MTTHTYNLVQKCKRWENLIQLPFNYDYYSYSLVFLAFLFICFLFLLLFFLLLLLLLLLILYHLLFCLKKNFSMFCSFNLLSLKTAYDFIFELFIHKVLCEHRISISRKYLSCMQTSRYSLCFSISTILVIITP